MRITENDITRSDEIISLIQDFKDGKRIQQKKRNGKQWINIEPGKMPSWDFEHYDYKSCPDTVPCCVSINLDYNLKERLDSLVQEQNTTINALFKNDLQEIIEKYIRQYKPNGLFEGTEA